MSKIYLQDAQHQACAISVYYVLLHRQCRVSMQKFSLLHGRRMQVHAKKPKDCRNAAARCPPLPLRLQDRSLVSRRSRENQQAHRCQGRNGVLLRQAPNSGLRPVLDAASAAASSLSCTVQPQQQPSSRRFFSLLDKLPASAVFSSLAGISGSVSYRKRALPSFQSLIIIAPAKKLPSGRNS